MNRRGSYRKLSANSKAALLAAIEIYNKPLFEYRDECFIILLINAWELLLKAILSKHKQVIFYPKKRGDKTYRTFTIEDSLAKVSSFFPPSVPYQAINSNLSRLIDYRNNTVHFYNEEGFEAVVYGLAQASIKNYRDLMEAIFHVDVANEINLILLPLVFGRPLDPIQFIQDTIRNPSRSKLVSNFIKEINDSTALLENRGIDTSRLIATFSVKLESIKKIAYADVLVGVESLEVSENTKVIVKRFDPNDPNWGRRKDILKRIPEPIKGIHITTFIFDAIMWKYDIKNKPNLYWQDKDGTLTKYSLELVAFINLLSEQEIKTARDEFSEYRKSNRKSKRTRK